MSRPCHFVNYRKPVAKSCKILCARTAFFPTSTHKLRDRRKLSNITFRGLSALAVSFWPNGLASWSPCSTAKMHRTISQFAGALSTEVTNRRDPAERSDRYGKRT